MGEQTYLVYEFGVFRLDPEHRILARHGVPIPLPAKTFDTLLLLVQNQGRVLEKDEMLDKLWSGSFVEESNLSQHIYLLRRALADEYSRFGFIQTIPRRGYIFLAPVQTSAAIAGNGLRSSLLAEYWKSHSPFRSLQTFEIEDAWLFFGRDSDTENLLERLGHSNTLVILGNSGSGKSSLIRAGVIPALRSGCFQLDGLSVSRWRFALLRPSASPFDFLAQSLSHQLIPELDLALQAQLLAHCRDVLHGDRDALRNAIDILVNSIPGSSRPSDILLVVDQFEEIFTLTSDQNVRDRYIDCLLSAGRMESAVRIHLVLAMRADFYSYCLEHRELSRCLETNLYNLPPMTGQQLRESIERRLQLAAACTEPGLIDALLEDVGAEPGNLALLEHALGELWNECGGYGCTLTNVTYSNIGRLRGSLGRHADEVYGSLGDERHKHQAQEIFLELVHLGDGTQNTRRRVRKADLLSLGPEEEMEQLLASLASSRLIATSREGNELFVEVSHEALIRSWPALCEWLDQNREELVLERRLLQAAHEWETLARDTGALLQGVRLAQGEEWLTRHHNAPSLLRQFIQEGVAARLEAARKEREAQERELAREQELRHEAEARAEAQNQLRLQQEAGTLQARRSAMRLRWFSCALIVLLLAVVGAAVYARHEQVLEKSRSLAVQARELLPRDHGQALQLAIASWKTARTDEAHVALAGVFPDQLAVLKHDGPVLSAMFSMDGERILTASADYTAGLWKSADGALIATLQGHTREITRAAFSPDGASIATASYDHTARIWDGFDGHLVAILKGHTDKLDWLAFSPDGGRIVTASRDHTARVWSRDGGRLLAVLKGHAAEVTRAEFSSDGEHVVTVSRDRTARVWNSVDGSLVVILAGHTAEVRCARFFPDNRRIITTSGDGSARIWDGADGRLLAVLPHDGPVENASLSPDGRFIVTASYDHTTRIWDARDGRLLRTLAQDGPVQDAEFSHNGRYVVTASGDHTARIWNSGTGQLLAILSHSGDAVYTAVFSPEDDRVVTAGADHTGRLWSLVTGLTLATLEGHSSYVRDAAFSPDGQHVVTASEDHTARIWNVDGRLLATLRGHADAVDTAEISPDGQRIVTASADGTARIWNADDGRLLTSLQGHTTKVQQARFSRDGLRVITASSDGTARIWSAADGHLLSTLRGHEGQVWRAEFSPDGERAVTSGEDDTARIWNAADGRLLATLRGHTEGVNVATFSPDGKTILTTSDDLTARLWRADDGSLLLSLRGHTHAIPVAAFSPDGQRIVTGGVDFAARIWNVDDGRLLKTLQGHSAEIHGTAFSPDGRLVLTASDDETARVWNSATGHLVTILQGHTGELSTAAFSPNGQLIVTASHDQTARIWRLATLEDIEALLAK